MDPLVILCFLAAFPFAALCAYLGWGTREYNPFAHRAQAGFLVVVFLGIPSLGAVLWAQSRAEARLRELGVEPHPAIRHVVGAAMGRDEIPIWLFRAEGDPGELLAHYLEPDTRPGWELRSHSPGLQIVLEQEDSRLHITARRDWNGTSITYHHLR